MSLPDILHHQKESILGNMLPNQNSNAIRRGRQNFRFIGRNSKTVVTNVNILKSEDKFYLLLIKEFVLTLLDIELEQLHQIRYHISPLALICSQSTMPLLDARKIFSCCTISWILKL